MAIPFGARSLLTAMVIVLDCQIDRLPLKALAMKQKGLSGCFQ